MRIRYFSLLILGFLTACVDTINIDPPAEENQLVIDAVLNNRAELQAIVLTLSTKALSKKVFDIERDSTTSTAVITVRNNKSGKIFNFKNVTTTAVNIDDGNQGAAGREVGTATYHWVDTVIDAVDGTPSDNEFGVLKSKDSLGVVGDELTLKIVFKGNTYTSTTKIERPARLEGFKLKKPREDGPFSPASTNDDEKEVVVEIQAYDPPGREDAFWIRGASEGVSSEVSTLVYDGSFDVGFDGTDGKIFIPPIRDLDFKYIEGGKITVQILSLTDEVFLFLQQVEDASNASAGLFAVTNSNLLTNVKNETNPNIRVAGIFSVSAVSRLATTISTQDIPK